MKNLFRVSALSVSLGLAGLLGTQAQAAEETPTTQSDDFDVVSYDRHKNLSSIYDVITQRRAQERQQQQAATTPTASDVTNTVAYKNRSNLSSIYDVITQRRALERQQQQAAQHQKEIQNN
ncbi:hypothetical protein [Staphylococcus delphini]|uniref:Uncharacterized protein n=1 Tax=Staphylococcus delphini TaxID=53344 RepID=A0AAX0QWP6_9STAP|nr:hypothetical protein [Staphylococcus delphini]PCF52189.1 hypothetical protein B5C07_01735 [Staphylococcus delphini]PNZ92506.1 hypothetical protein CD148_09415 [Staphylococcus delphini]RIZ49278.1 hypothetical protein CDL68_12170 [Staphylococcus delphini]VED63274.1 Uncharacterised protein [Staphylococcus delphini]